MDPLARWRYNQFKRRKSLKSNPCQEVIVQYRLIDHGGGLSSLVDRKRGWRDEERDTPHTLIHPNIYLCVCMPVCVYICVCDCKFFAALKTVVLDSPISENNFLTDSLMGAWNINNWNALAVTVIVRGNGLVDPSSNPGRYIYIYIKSKVGDLNRGWPKGSLFDSYYTKV